MRCRSWGDSGARSEEYPSSHVLRSTWGGGGLFTPSVIWLHFSTHHLPLQSDTMVNCTYVTVCMSVHTLYGTVYTLTWKLRRYKHTDPSRVYSISIYCILFIWVCFYFILFCFLWVSFFPALLLFVLLAHCSPVLMCQIEVLPRGIIKGTSELVLFHCLYLRASTDHLGDLRCRSSRCTM